MFVKACNYLGMCVVGTVLPPLSVRSKNDTVFVPILLRKKMSALYLRVFALFVLHHLVVQ